MLDAMWSPYHRVAFLLPFQVEDNPTYHTLLSVYKLNTQHNNIYTFHNFHVTYRGVGQGHVRPRHTPEIVG